ncbi:hypothetical protein Ct9H90mP29_07390 [bacterium]|nr:MAG: hypothetical protein Ct9H90mP29_07390 [bacterium]
MGEVYMAYSSPYRGNVSAFDGYNDFIAVKIGAYGVYDNLA